MVAEAGLEPTPCCGARHLPASSVLLGICRPLPLAQVASSATGSAPFAPLREPGGRPGLASQAEKKKNHTIRCGFLFLVAEAGLEPTTSGL